VNKISTRVYLDQDLIDWAKEEADRRHCSMAQIIRTALVEMRQRQEESPLQVLERLAARGLGK
jgi:ribosome biogenesis protein Tsr3